MQNLLSVGKERSRRGCEVAFKGQNSTCISSQDIIFDGHQIKGSKCYCNDESLCNEAIMNYNYNLVYYLSLSIVIHIYWSSTYYFLDEERCDTRLERSNKRKNRSDHFFSATLSGGHCHRPLCPSTPNPLPSAFPSIPCAEIKIFSNLRWGKNPHFQKFTYWNSQFLQNSHFWNLILHKIHFSEFPIFTKFTFLKTQVLQNSHFWKPNFFKIHNSENQIFHKIHIFEISKSREFLAKKWDFIPAQCEETTCKVSKSKSQLENCGFV